MIETRIIPANGTNVAIHQTGSGPPAMLVHGFPLDHRMWTDVLRSDLAKQRTLYAIDLRGHGHSPWAGDEAHDMEVFASDLAAVTRTLADEPLDLVGLSMGGYVAMVMAEAYPELLRSVTLADCRAGTDVPAAKEARLASIETVATKGRHELALQMLTKLVAEDCSATVRARLQTMIEGTPIETIIADQRGMLARKDRNAALAKLSVPALVVVGSLDLLSPPEEAESMAQKIPDSELQIIEGAGHMTPMERPAQFCDLLGNFWKR